MTFILQGISDKERTTRLATCEDERNVETIAHLMLECFLEVQYILISDTNKPYMEPRHILHDGETIKVPAIWVNGG